MQRREVEKKEIEQARWRRGGEKRERRRLTTAVGQSPVDDASDGDLSCAFIPLDRGPLTERIQGLVTTASCNPRKDWRKGPTHGTIMHNKGIMSHPTGI